MAFSSSSYLTAKSTSAAFSSVSEKTLRYKPTYAKPSTPSVSSPPSASSSAAAQLLSQVALDYLVEASVAQAIVVGQQLAEHRVDASKEGRQQPLVSEHAHGVAGRVDGDGQVLCVFAIMSQADAILASAVCADEPVAAGAAATGDAAGAMLTRPRLAGDGLLVVLASVGCPLGLSERARTSFSESNTNSTKRVVLLVGR